MPPSHPRGGGEVVGVPWGREVWPLGGIFAGTTECRIFVGDKQIQEIDEAKLNL